MGQVECARGSTVPTPVGVRVIATQEPQRLVTPDLGPRGPRSLARSSRSSSTSRSPVCGAQILAAHSPDPSAHQSLPSCGDSVSGRHHMHVAEFNTT